jgi:hypothetical protein
VLFYRGARRGGHAKSQRFGGDGDFHPGRKSGSVTTEMENDAGMWAPSVRYRGGGTARSDREQGMASVARGRAPAAAGSGTRERIGQPGPLRPC